MKYFEEKIAEIKEGQLPRIETRAKIKLKDGQIGRVSVSAVSKVEYEMVCISDGLWTQVDNLSCGSNTTQRPYCLENKKQIILLKLLVPWKWTSQMPKKKKKNGMKNL